MATDALSLLDPSKQFEDLFRRVQRLEQGISSPAVTGVTVDPTFNTVTVATGGTGTTIVSTTPPAAPGAPTASFGAFFDRLFINVSWTAVAGAWSYLVEYAVKTSGVYATSDNFQTIGNDIRIEPVRPNTTYGVRISAINRLGIVGAASAWTDVAVGADSTVPGQVTGLTLYRGATTIVANWTESTDVDVKFGNGLYKVQVSTNSGFTAITDDIVTSATVVSFSNKSTETTFYVRVAAIDSSGNQGIFSATQSILAGGIISGMIGAGQVGTTQISNDAITSPLIAANAVVSAKIAAGEIITAHMTAGAINADRLTTNTLNVNRITSSSLTTQTITLAGGSIVGGAGATGPGFILNSQGFSLYAAGGTRTVYLNGVDGSATFTGTVLGGTIVGGSIAGATITGNDISGGTIIGTTYKTASFGARIVIDSTPTGSGLGTYNFMDFWSNFASGAEWRPSEIYASWADYGSAAGKVHQFSLACGQLTSAQTTANLLMTSSGHTGTANMLSQAQLQASEVTLGYAANTDSTIYARGTLYVTRFLRAEGYQKTPGSDVIYATNGRIRVDVNQDGDWGYGGVLSTGSADHAGFCWWAPAYSTAGKCFGRGSTNSFYISNTGATAGIPLFAASFNTWSSIKFKLDVRPAATDRAKFRNLKAKKFKYIPAPDCTLCKQTGKTPNGDICPACGGTGDARRPEVKAREDGDRFGLIAEEVYALFPEACFLDEMGQPFGVMWEQVVAILWDVVMQQDADVVTSRADIADFKRRFPPIGPPNP